MWELSTGELIGSFEAHYKKVNVIRITDDGSLILTAGEDSAEEE